VDDLWDSFGDFQVTAFIVHVKITGICGFGKRGEKRGGAWGLRLVVFKHVLLWNGSPTKFWRFEGDHAHEEDLDSAE
jgi:hypothetical protein